MFTGANYDDSRGYNEVYNYSCHVPDAHRLQPFGGRRNIGERNGHLDCELNRRLDYRLYHWINCRLDCFRRNREQHDCAKYRGHNNRSIIKLRRNNNL